MRIGPAALFAERRTLSHPETVLLVDDGEREALERNVFFDERMRPDHDVERALGEPGQDRPARVTGHARGEERVGGSAISEQRPERAGVLLGEKLGRCHERGLRS